jgi:hypothetical protein
MLLYYLYSPAVIKSDQKNSIFYSCADPRHQQPEAHPWLTPADSSLSLSLFSEFPLNYCSVTN